MRRGVAELPLHGGSAPKWLFERMRRLSSAIIQIIIEEYGPLELLERVSDSFWFQSLGCVLGFDWHSSGLTTTLCAALKEGVKGMERDLGIYIAGGKGRTSRRTPEEIEFDSLRYGAPGDKLVYASRMAAKVDSAGLQDGYQLYHHTFFFTKKGEWAIVQQGMNTETKWARRYHWLSQGLKDFVIEPHKAILCDHTGDVLNMVDRKSKETQKISTRIAAEPPDRTAKELKKIRKLHLEAHHPVLYSDMDPKRIERILLKTYENPPEDFEALLGREGIGPKTIRALAFISEVTYGAEPSFHDPVSYSFAHGGKDGHPYPINRAHYDKSIRILEKAIKGAKIGNREKLDTLKRLGRLWM